MKDPRRNRAMMPSVKKIFRRRSGVRKIRPTALNNAASCFRKSQSGGRSPGHPTELLDGWLLDGTTSGDDLLLGGAGDLVDRNDQLNRNVPVAENLDLFVLANGSLGDEVRDGDVTAGRVQLGELLQVHDLVLDPERVLEAAQLRRTHVHRKLAALEARTDLVARLGALGTTAGRLTLGTFTASDAGLVLLGSGGRAQVVHLEDLLAGLRDILLGRSLGGRLGRHGLVLRGGGGLVGGGRSRRLLGRSLLRGALLRGRLVGGLRARGLGRGLLGGRLLSGLG